jgi:quercetin dioxygenase-like cupin family protein
MLSRDVRVRDVQTALPMDVYRLEEYLQTSPAGFTKRVIQQSPGGLIFLLNFAPGQSLPSHTHDNSELIVTVIEGIGEAKVEERGVPLHRGVIVHCRGKESFSVSNTGTERLSLLVFLYPGNPKFAANVR